MPNRNDFDWQTEEDDRRAQEAWDEPQPAPLAARRLPSWRVLALIGGLLLAVGALVWWRVDRRIDATMQAVRTDVIASHNVVQQAAAEADVEIFRAFLSGRDANWTAGVIEVFENQLLVDRAPFGLTPAENSLPAILAAPGAEAAAGQPAANITLAPDLSEAVVTIDQPYLTEGGTTVALQQTTVYRRGDQRWLLAPPLAEFWGQWQSASGDYLTLFFPERDAELAQTLAADLDEAIAKACATLADLDCSQDLRLSVRLDDNPATLAALSAPLGALRQARETGDILELPTPTLVGLPGGATDAARQAAYDALYRGYARHVVGAAIATATNWRCCEKVLLFQALLDQQLSELGLLDRPLSQAEDYQQILEQRLTLGDMSAYFQSAGDAGLSEARARQGRVVVDFLMNAVPGVSAAELQRLAGRSTSFSRFLAAIWPNSSGDAPPVSPEVAWWLYAYQGTLSPEPPDAPPDDELYLGCTAVGVSQRPEASLLLQYLPDEAEWRELYRLDGFIWMNGLSGGNGLMVQELALVTETWQTSLWRDGERTPLTVPSGSAYSISFGQTDPIGDGLVAYTAADDGEQGRITLVDLAECDGDCAATSLPGQPIWSPGGAWVLYSGYSFSFPSFLLATGDSRYTLIDSSSESGDEPLRLGRAGSDEMEALDQGYAPFWLDETTYGYVRHVGGGARRFEDTEIVSATLDDPTPQVVLRASELAQFLPDLSPAARLVIGYVAVHPAQPNRLFIVALEALEDRAYVFLLDLADGRPELRLDLLYDLNHSLGFSPDGRYLVVTGRDRPTISRDEDRGVLLLHDIAANRTVPFTSRLPFFLASAAFDWSADSRYLALALDDNLVGLVAPDEGSVQLLPHTYGACTSLAWLEKSDE